MAYRNVQYDNIPLQRRELWRDGRLVAFWTRMELEKIIIPEASGHYYVEPWGAFQDSPLGVMAAVAALATSSRAIQAQRSKT
jgi:hypothetical protein